MSRIGKKPIIIPSSVTLSQQGHTLLVKGPKGELSLTYNPSINVTVDDGKILVNREDDSKINRSLHGLIRSLIANNITGVTQGFEKKLEINGVGYRAQVQGKKLILNLGYSHPVEYAIPSDVSVEMDKEKKNLLIIKGIDKQAVGQTAAVIRGFKKPEPYKGKGIKYLEEVIIRKAGKTAAKEKTA